MKIVINRCYGGFGLSKEALDIYCEKKGINPGKWNNTWKFYEDFSDTRIDRTDPILISIVEELGQNADGYCAELSIIEIPDNVEYYINDYDGMETVHEKHRTWS